MQGPQRVTLARCEHLAATVSSLGKRAVDRNQLSPGHARLAQSAELRSGWVARAEQHTRTGGERREGIRGPRVAEQLQCRVQVPGLERLVGSDGADDGDVGARGIELFDGFLSFVDAAAEERDAGRQGGARG